MSCADNFKNGPHPAQPSAYSVVAVESVYDLVRAEVFSPNRGQLGWCGEDEIDIIHHWIRPCSRGRLLDLGSGLGGILCELISRTHLSGLGIDQDIHCVDRARHRAAQLKLASKVEFQVHDLTAGMNTFCQEVQAVIAIDMFCHLRSRASVLKQLATACEVGCLIIFTDSMVIGGEISNEFISERSFFGYSQFVVPGFNNHVLESCGFELLEQLDLSDAVRSIAKAWRNARDKHRLKLLSVENDQTFSSMDRYLARCIEGTEKQILRRELYVARLVRKPCA